MKVNNPTIKPEDVINLFRSLKNDMFTYKLSNSMLWIDFNKSNFAGLDNYIKNCNYPKLIEYYNELKQFK